MTFGMRVSRIYEFRGKGVMVIWMNISLIALERTEVRNPPEVYILRESIYEVV